MHGTGTPLGDPIEVNALGQALGQTHMTNVIALCKCTTPRLTFLVCLRDVCLYLDLWSLHLVCMQPLLKYR